MGYREYMNTNTLGNLENLYGDEFREIDWMDDDIEREDEYNSDWEVGVVNDDDEENEDAD